MIVFDKYWFAKYQRKLLFFLNFPILRIWFRYLMRIKEPQKITKIMPNLYEIRKGKEIIAKIRTHNKYSKRLYYGLKYLWYFLHFLDLFLDKRIPKLSFGFTTLTFYPDVGSGLTTVDGRMEYYDGAGLSWATIHDAASSNYVNTITASMTSNLIRCDTNTDKFDDFIRSLFTFDTSAIGSGATISSADFYIRTRDSVDWRYTELNASQTIELVSSNPASNNDIVVGDYSSFGTTKFATGITLSTLSQNTYSNFSLNASGLAAISKTGITKLGIRLGNDLDDIAPAWQSAKRDQLQIFFADETGTTSDPYLTVTYTTGAVATNKIIGIL